MRAILGKLQWVASQVRPDVSFQVCQLLGSSKDWQRSHFELPSDKATQGPFFPSAKSVIAFQTLIATEASETMFFFRFQMIFFPGI